MKIIRNDPLIKRNARIAQITTLGGLSVLIAGMVLSFIDQQKYWSFSIIALFLGFLLSQVGIFYSNHWGRRPRPDEILDQALKGLDGRYTMFHYKTPVSHLLIGPSGMWILFPYYQRGTITYSKGRWRQKGGNIYLKIFAQEGLGRPDLEVQGERENLRRYLTKKMPEEELPPIQAALVFTNPKAVIAIPEDETPPAYTVTIKELKEIIRKSAKTTSLPSEKAKLIGSFFEP